MSVIILSKQERNEYETNRLVVSFASKGITARACHPDKFDIIVDRDIQHGIVILEAMACGTPAAAYPVTGPKDQIINGLNGYTSHSLSNAVLQCFALDNQAVYNTVKDVSWKKSTDKFLEDIA